MGPIFGSIAKIFEGFRDVVSHLIALRQISDGFGGSVHFLFVARMRAVKGGYSFEAVAEKGAKK